MNGRALASLLVRWLLILVLVFPPSPVRADEVFTLTATADATLQQALPTTNDGVSAILRALSQSGGNIRHLVQFDLSSLDPTAAVKTSTLRMTLNSAPFSSRNLAAHAVTGATPWTEGGVTWDTRDGSTAWTTPGGDFNSTPADTQPSGTTSGASLSWNIRSDGTFSNIPQGWLDGTVLNRGLLLKDASEDEPPHAVISKVVTEPPFTLCVNNCTTTRTFPGGQSVDPTKSFLIFQTRNNTTTSSAYQIRGTISSPTQVTFARTGDNTAVNVKYYVVEFAQGVIVERGVVNQGTATTPPDIIDVPLTSFGSIASTSQMFVLYSKTPRNTDTNWNRVNPVIADVTSTSNLRIRIGVANAFHDIRWEVIAFQNPADINVQRGTITTMTGATTSVVVPLTTPVDPNRSFVLLSDYSMQGGATFGGTDLGSRVVTAQLTNCTPNCSQLTVTRNLSGSPDNFDGIAWQVVELRTGATVQTGSQTFAAGVPPATPAQTVATAAITTVDTTRAFAFSASQMGGGANGGRTPWTGNQNVGVVSFTMDLAASTLTMQRNYNSTNAGNSAILNWQVVEMNNTNPGLVSPASREDSTPANRPQLDVSLLRNVSLGSVTPGISEVTLNWTFPSGSTSSNYDGVLIARRQGLSAPTFAPADGTTYTVGQQPVAGEFIAANTSNFTTVTVTDENGPDNVITPATDYSYKLYTRDNNTISGAANPAPPHYSFGTSTTTTTLSPGPTTKLWSYKTSATALSPPGLAPGGSIVVGSNDNKFHSMSATDGSRRYQPSGSIGTTDGGIQARSPVIPAAFTTGVDCDKVTPGIQPCDVAFVGAADGNAYAFDVATGNMIWTAPSPVALPGGSVVGGAAVQLDAFSNPGFAPSCAPCDLVFFGSRNIGGSDTSNNQVVALNANTGAVVWTFAPGNMDGITSTPMVDYATNTVWVASLSNSGSQPSLWKLNSSTGALIESFSLGDISREPTLNSDGRVLYALLDSGSLAAVRTDVSACSFTLAPASGSGVGFPVPSPTAANNDDIFFTTTGTVNKFHFSYTPGVCAGTLTDLNGSGWTNPTLTNPSGVVVIPFAVVPVPQIFVGDGNGTLLRINSTTGAVAASRLVEASAVIGEPAIDLVHNRIYVGSSSGRIYAFSLF